MPYGSFLPQVKIIQNMHSVLLFYRAEKLLWMRNLNDYRKCAVLNQFIILHVVGFPEDCI